MASVRLEGIVKSFGNVEAIHGIDLTVGDKEFFTLVGPSGCGKSTILNIIAGLEELSSGRILFNEEPVDGLSPKERDVAFVFQSYALYPHKNVYENIAFPLRMAEVAVAEIDSKVRNAASLLGLEEFLHRMPKELSGGQRQRVALGRAIVRNPRVFLLDEPLSNLDAALRVQMRAELKRLQHRLQCTFIYVTHDQAEAMTLSDRLAVIRDGRVEQCGTPREVYNRPLNKFVASFLGSPPMNFIPGRFLQRHVEIGNYGLLLSPEESQVLDKKLRTQKVILGIRPENVKLFSQERPGTFKAIVSVVEPMGAESFVTLVFSGHRIVARVGADFTAREDEELFIAFDKEKLHFFDATTEKNVLLKESKE
ncbi:MAG: ABC transporter ATP-binding protein [Candidatus Brocadiales bacterium]